ncbi:MAG: hypothetical protein RLZZ40_950, partial [Actinomycetota bacterium]
MAHTLFHIGRRSALGIRRFVRATSARVRDLRGRAIRGLRSDGFRRVGIVSVASTLVGAFALPAFALTPVTVDNSVDGHVIVAADGTTTTISKDNFKALTAAQAARLGRSLKYPSYSGPSVSDYLKNPAYPDYDLAALFAVAKKYIGVPYRYGGASPAGFDCSGYVQFVYAQFGIELPHNSAGQAGYGKPIHIQDARPGDLVIMPGHNGFYAGNGMILDAPRAGGVVSIRPI